LNSEAKGYGRLALAFQAAKTFEMAVYLVTSLVVVHQLAPATYGEYSLSLAIGTLGQSICGLGIEETVERGVHSRRGLTRAYRRRGEASAVGAALTVPVALALHLSIALIIGAALFLVASGFNSLAVSQAIVLRARRATAVAVSSGAVVGLVTTTVVLALGGSAAGAVIALACAQTASCVMIRILSSPLLQALPMDQETSAEGNRITNGAFWLNNTLGPVFGKQSDIIILRTTGAPSATIGLYSLAQSVVTLVGYALIQGLGAVGLRAVADADERPARDTWTTIAGASALLSTIPVLVILAAGPACLRWLYGPAYASAYRFVVIAAVSLAIVRALGGGTSQLWLYRRHQERLDMYLRVATGIAGLFLNVALAITVGPIGVAVGTGATAVVLIAIEFSFTKLPRKLLPWRTAAAAGSALAAGLIGRFTVGAFAPSDAAALAGIGTYLTVLVVTSRAFRPVPAGMIAVLPKAIKPGARLFADAPDAQATS
jgi:O-antigen/teichoic acid export membrane protein